MPTPQEWMSKSRQSLAAARRNLAEGDLLTAANRLWFAIYQGVHAVLIHKGRTPRQDLGTWAHEDTTDLYADVCRFVRTRRARASLSAARRVVEAALVWRVAADYGDHGLLDQDQLQRATGQISRVLKYMEEECLR